MKRRAGERSAQDREEARCPVDFVDDHEPVQVVRQVEFGLREPGPVLLGLQTQVQRVAPGGEFQRQRGLARLARSQQDDSGLLVEAPVGPFPGQSVRSRP